MASVFAIDLKNSSVYTKQANVIRLGILKDNLEDDDVTVKMAELLLVAVENNDNVQVKRRAYSLLDYLDIQYEGTELLIRKALNELVNI